MSRRQTFCWAALIAIVAQITLLPLAGAEPGGLLNWWAIICLFYLLAPALVLLLLVSLPVKWRWHPLWLLGAAGAAGGICGGGCCHALASRG